MFPSRELTSLARGKDAIRARIARERSGCLDAAKAAARPLRWLDRVHAWWRGTPAVFKFAAVPLLFLLKAKFFPKKRRRGVLARWAPLAWQIARAARNLSSAEFRPKAWRIAR